MDVVLLKEEEYNLKKYKMARYIGPKSKIARKFGEPIFGSDKSFEKEIILLDNMVTINVEEKNQSMQFN